MAKTYYEILKVNFNASQESIKKAYDALREQPDNILTDGSIVTSEDIKIAYKTLYNKDKRVAYDKIMKLILAKKYKEAEKFAAGHEVDDISLSVYYLQVASYFIQEASRYNHLGKLLSDKSYFTLSDNYFQRAKKCEALSSKYLQSGLSQALEATDKSYCTLFKSIKKIGSRFKKSPLTEQKKLILRDFSLYCLDNAETMSRQDLVDKWEQSYKQKHSGQSPFATLRQHRYTGFFSRFNPEKTDSLKLFDAFKKQDPQSRI